VLEFLFHDVYIKKEGAFYIYPMAFNYSPKTVTNGLQVYIDAANIKSYSGAGASVYDLSPATGFTYSLREQATWSSTNNGTFQFPSPIGTATASRVESIGTQNWNSDSMTIDVWLNRTSSNNTYNIVWDVYLPYLSFYNANFFRFSWRTGGNLVQRVLDTASTYSDNTWYNVCCTLDQNIAAQTSIAKIYVNGALTDTSPTYAATASYTITSALRLGNWAGPRYPFVGSISNFKLYNRVLTDAEILQNYRALKGRFE
jgi:hypothetical protein